MGVSAGRAIENVSADYITVDTNPSQCGKESGCPSVSIPVPQRWTGHSSRCSEQQYGRITVGVVVEEGHQARAGGFHPIADVVEGGVLVEVNGLFVGEVEGQPLNRRILLVRAEFVNMPGRLGRTEIPAVHVGLDLVHVPVHPHGCAVGALEDVPGSLPDIAGEDRSYRSGTSTVPWPLRGSSAANVDRTFCSYRRSSGSSAGDAVSSLHLLWT